MRRSVVTTLAVFAVVLGGLAATASANPAQRWSTSECFPFYDYEVCGTWSGLDRYTFTPSGNLSWTSHYRADYTFRYVPTGDVLSTTSLKSNLGGLTKGSEVHVNHDEFVARTSYGDVTCRSVFRHVWANGELRHELQDFSCS